MSDIGRDFSGRKYEAWMDELEIIHYKS